MINDQIGDKISVCLDGIDTPEIRGKCPNEKQLAKKAKDRVNQILKAAGNIELRHIRRGKYFRIIATT